MDINTSLSCSFLHRQTSANLNDNVFQVSISYFSVHERRLGCAERHVTTSSNFQLALSQLLGLNWAFKTFMAAAIYWRQAAELRPCDLDCGPE